MEIYRALADFAPPDRPYNVLAFRKGDYFEVLETERDSRDWWGARRLDDDAIGYVPAKYLRYDERRVGKLLPEDYGRSREMHIRELEEMQRREDYRLPDVYKLPPLDTRAMDQWRTDAREAAEIEVPPADYSDSEEEDASDYQQISAKLENNLSLDEWRKIIESAETDDLEIPEPDYPDDEDAVNGSPANHSRTGGVVEAKKLPNPCMESRERMNLHRELLMNQKLGVNVLNKKSELKKEFERRTTERKKREHEEYRMSKRTSLEKKLEEQANKLKLQDEQNRISPDKTIPEEQQPEFVRIHSKIKGKGSTDSKSSK